MSDRERRRELAIIWFWRVAILATAICAWQFLPKIESLRGQAKWLNPFFISSPERVYHEIVRLVTGSHGTPPVWPELWVTVKATLVGTAVGLLLGVLLGAVLSNNERLAQIFSGFIAMLNAMPRVALIPIIVIIVGSGERASMVASAIIVTFLTFFNAFEGGRSVPAPILQNAHVLGAKNWQVMVRVRLPNVMIWTFAAVPNAVAFGLVSVVTTELLTGTIGMGGLMLTATSNLNADLSFAVMIILSVVGIALVAIAERIKRRVLHWR